MPNHFEVFKLNSRGEAAALAGETLNNLLIKHSKSPVLLLLSGGSAFDLLDYVSAKALGENLAISLLDERFSQDPAINNFSRLQTLEFYTLAAKQEANFIGTLPRPDESLAAFAQRLENSWRKWKTQNPGGRIFATFGMGEDGHTAGMFPLADKLKFDELYNSANWVAAHALGAIKPWPERVTATLTFFKLIDEGMAYICGQNKREKLAEVLTSKPSLSSLPGAGLKLVKNMDVFTDIS